jgi:hypothetical protein
MTTSGTVDVKGSKSVKVKTSGYEKCRMMVTPSIQADGSVTPCVILTRLERCALWNTLKFQRCSLCHILRFSSHTNKFGHDMYELQPSDTVLTIEKWYFLHCKHISWILK